MAGAGQNEPCYSLRRHGRSTSVSGPAGPAVGASGSGQNRSRERVNPRTQVVNHQRGSSARLDILALLPLTSRRNAICVFSRLFRQACFTQILRDAVGVLLPRQSFQPEPFGDGETGIESEHLGGGSSGLLVPPRSSGGRCQAHISGPPVWPSPGPRPEVLQPLALNAPQDIDVPP